MSCHGRGDQAASAAVFIDADLFFSMLFGSERFRPYLGTLFMAAAIGNNQLHQHHDAAAGPARPGLMVDGWCQVS